jgi:anti-sigma regulatory factor (Ser/Thr protein kinase)
MMQWLPNPPASLALVTTARHWSEGRVREAGGSSEHSAVVALVTSELVTNAVMHAAGPIEVALDTDGDHTRVEVWDGSPERAAQPARHDETSESQSESVGGWGLALIARLSDRWGISRTPASKCVWSEINGAG